jgi:hypothetical protein
VRCATSRRQHEHRNIAQIADALQHLPAVEARHPDVEQHEVGPLVMELSQPFLTVSGSNHVDSSPFEDRGNQVPHIVFVVDHERSRHAAFISGEAGTASA